MSQQNPSAFDRTTVALNELRPATQGVNDAAEQLAKSISSIERTLKSMNVNFEAWTTYRDGDDDHNFDHWDVGYSRVNGRWGICVRTVTGSTYNPDEMTVTPWHFNESPLYLRPQAVTKLPELLEALVKTAPNVEQKLRAAADQAAQIAQAVNVAKSKK